MVGEDPLPSLFGPLRALALKVLCFVCLILMTISPFDSYKEQGPADHWSKRASWVSVFRQGGTPVVGGWGGWSGCHGDSGVGESPGVAAAWLSSGKALLGKSA